MIFLANKQKNRKPFYYYKYIELAFPYQFFLSKVTLEKEKSRLIDFYKIILNVSLKLRIDYSNQMFYILSVGTYIRLPKYKYLLLRVERFIPTA